MVVKPLPFLVGFKRRVEGFGQKEFDCQINSTGFLDKVITKVLLFKRLITQLLILLLTDSIVLETLKRKKLVVRLLSILFMFIKELREL